MVVTAATRRRRTIAVTLLVIAGCVNYLDRSAVAVGNPEIRADLHLSYAQMGLLLSAFAWAYGLAQLPAGATVDRLGPRRAMGFAMVLWSVAQIGAGFVASLGSSGSSGKCLRNSSEPFLSKNCRTTGCNFWIDRKSSAQTV